MRSNFLNFLSQIPEEQINPSEEYLLSLCKKNMIENNAGVPLFHTKISARSAKFTDVIGLSGDDTSNLDLIKNQFEEIDPSEFIVCTVSLGKHPEIQLKSTYAVHKSSANKALMMSRNFFSSNHAFQDSSILSFDNPKFDGRKVIVDPRSGQRVSYLLGIDYYGEAKMSLLRMGMEIMRQDMGGLGLHAGSKTYTFDSKEVGMLIFGLSGTGKTTLTTNTDGPFDLVAVLQDDINFLASDAKSYGTEKGFYVKTDNSPEHKEITAAVLHPSSVMENVFVDEEGNIQWKNFSLTRNGRAIVKRSELKGTTDFIDLPELNFILFNTRRPDLPPIGRLKSHVQAAAYYGLGESVITSAEDPGRAGESKRVVGFDPFILGLESININRIRNILETKKNVTCFVVNTGFVGSEENDITVNITLSSIIAAITGKTKWRLDDDLGYEVPVNPEYDISKYDPREVMGNSNFVNRMTELREERRQFLSQFPGIDEEIIGAI